MGTSGDVVSGARVTTLAVGIVVMLLAGQHDAAARLREISIPGEGSVTYGQYQGGAPQQIVLPGGVVKSMAYDPLSGMVSNRVVDVSGNPVMERTYQRNRAGTITGVNTEHGSYTYAYDQIDQLTHVADPMLPDQAFSYDGAGNRVTSGRYPKPGTGDPELKTYTVNNLNQYLSVTSASSAVQMSYDLNGNVTQEVVNGESRIFRWDGENRLVGYSNSETGVSASYYYDPFGRRLRKVVNGVTNWYVYADEGLVEEMDGQGNEVRSYGYAPNSPWMNNPVYMRVPGEGTTNIYYFLNDHLGAPQKMVAKNGEVVWSMESEAFGQATVSPDSTVTNNLRLSSQYFDEESGLHYNTQRYYDPKSGRYGSRDPFGEGEGLSLYTFANSNPYNGIDPRGEATFVEVFVGVVVVYIVAEQFVYWFMETYVTSMQNISTCALIRQQIASSGGTSGAMPATFVRYEGVRWPFVGKREIRFPTSLNYRCDCINGQRNINVSYRQDDGVYKRLKCDGTGVCP